MAMSKQDEDRISAAKDKWNKANAAGDQAGMDAAHKEAESVRSKYNYSGGDDGSQHISLSGSGGSKRAQKKPANGGVINYGNSSSGNSGTASSSSGSGYGGSSYDQKYFTEDELRQAAQARADAAAGKISWDESHQLVESTRKKYNYSGGEDGSQYISLTQQGGSGETGGYAGSIFDDIYLTAEERQQIADVRADAAAGKISWDDAHRFAEAIRKKYGYSGGEDGSQYIPGTQFTYANAPSYTNRYQDKIDELTREILQREAFSYDPEKDPLYLQYRDSYTRNGQRAMQDTLGQVSARTGGLASSYAGSAAQQTYDNYMGALADKIPELQQLAYSMYQDEGNTQRANLEMLVALEQGDYSKYADLLSQYNTDRNFQYNAHRDNLSDERYDKEWNYSVGRDQLADERYDREYADNQTAQKKADAQQRIQAFLAAYGKVSALDPELVKESGYSQAELAALEAYYTEQHNKELYGYAGYSGGSSGRSSSRSGSYSGYSGSYSGGTGTYSAAVNNKDKGLSPWKLEGDSWVWVANAGRMSYTEIAAGVKSGYIRTFKTKDGETHYSYDKEKAEKYWKNQNSKSKKK